MKYKHFSSEMKNDRMKKLKINEVIFKRLNVDES